MFGMRIQLLIKYNNNEAIDNKIIYMLLKLTKFKGNWME